jgi:HAE1 family hydrophobic/amphiphilic exporter-1
MSFLTGLALRRRPVTILIMVLVLVAGLIMFTSLQQELYPEIDVPVISVFTVFPSANADAMVRDVTEPIENAISGAEGLLGQQSTSSEGRSLIIANFEFGTDMQEMERSIASNINSIQFPAGVTQPRVSKLDPGAIPVLQLSVLGDRDIPQLQRIVDDLVIPEIEKVSGVFSADVVGSVDERIVVTLDSGKLDDLGLSPLQVASAIRENNLSLPGGDVTDQGRSYLVRTSHEIGALSEIGDLVIGYERASGQQLVGRPIRLSDVAEVRFGTAEARSISRTNGLPSLGLNILKDPDANTVEVAHGVLERLGQLDSLPADIEIITIINQAPEIEKQIDTLGEHALLGFVFAVLVVFGFLVNFRPGLFKGITLALRPTIVTAVSIPLSIFAGLLLVGAQGLTLNFMTLGGLAIAVGRVVDDSIVVMENVYRHIQTGESRFEAALNGTREVAGAITSSTLTTVVVFAPLALIPGLVGTIFLPFALAVTYSLLASLIVALTAVPVMGAIFLRQDDLASEAGVDGAQSDTWFQRLYTPALVWSLRHKFSAVAIALILTISSLGLTAFIPITLFPASPPDSINIEIELPSGTAAGRTFQEAIKAEAIVGQLVEQGIMETYQTSLGTAESAFSAGGAGLNAAVITASLTDSAPDGVADAIRRQLPSHDEVKIKVTEVAANAPGSSDLAINVTGTNFSAIASVARQLEDQVRGLGGIVNVSSDLSDAREELFITINPEQAAEFGISTAAAAQQVSILIDGQVVSDVDLEGVTLDIVVRGQPENADQINEIKNLEIQGLSGKVPLAFIADIALKDGPVSITRIDGDRSVTISGNITAQDVGAINQLVQAKIDGMDIPLGVTVSAGGVSEDIDEAFRSLFLAIGSSVVLVYLVMVASTGSLRNPFVIIMSLPLAVVGAMVALAITGRSLGLPAMMGFLMLVGIVVTNAIVLVEFVEHLRARGMNLYDALVEGGRVRLRPILMTAVTTIMALIPIAAFGGADSGIIGPDLGVVVIGGLVSSTFLTLLVVPVIYTIMHESIPGALNSMAAALRRAMLPSSVPVREVREGHGGPGD